MTTKKRLGRFLLAAALLAALTGCAPTTFLVSKDGSSTYFGRRNSSLALRLCSSGELANILDHADIRRVAKDGFFRYNCTEEYSREKVLSLYLFLSPEEKQELMRAFGDFGYEVNLIRC